MTPVIHCRLCLSKVEMKLALTPTPIANAFTEEASGGMCMKYPLDLCECPSCGHVQLGLSISGDTLFQNYKYRTPEVERIRLAEYAAKLAQRFPFALGTSSGRGTDRPKVIEIGSNNGLFVNELRTAGFFAVGIDPSGPQTGMPRWFNSKTAKNIAYSLGKMKMILANNVFAHVDDLRNIFVGIDRVLDDDGVVIFEVQYFPKMVDLGAFDMVYHEHKSYHTLKPLPRFLAKFGMCMFDYEHLDTHGGSIRVYCKRGSDGIKVPDEVIDWALFKSRIDDEKERINKSLTGRVAAFGATAKATTLIHHFGLQDKISYCVDETPEKKGLFVPGTNIRIVGVDALESQPPDMMLLTAWNYADYIRSRFNIPMVVPFH